MEEIELTALKLSLNEKVKKRYAIYLILAIAFITTIDELFGKAIFDFSIEVSTHLQTYNLFSICYVLSYYMHYLPAPFFSAAIFFRRDKVKCIMNLFCIFLCLWKIFLKLPRLAESLKAHRTVSTNQPRKKEPCLMDVIVRPIVEH